MKLMMLRDEDNKIYICTYTKVNKKVLLHCLLDLQFHCRNFKLQGFLTPCRCLILTILTSSGELALKLASEK